ncbi:LOW QUALITY PROTEIN: chromodomain-helicase-DNA-binding protein 6-like [Mus pahari]|uniref:LOW QUALITY PROTEIN: chromodomain-helicase-DNA-binding protein 6-like n=1 Tax=Mus pahari TaxID=10093 RepID=UPI000A30D381|nr:LOW QUALITY PROTEIN: chromodomain-helicase-DNA-binding protein 6-like [Mus pahari]
MKMKIQKKDKQLSKLRALNHSPMSDASVNFDYKSPSPFDRSPDQEENVEEVANHSLTPKDLYSTEEESDTLFPRKLTSHHGMENSGGRGTGLKKKRKKKEPGEQEGTKRSKDREPKTKRKREPEEPKEPRRAKEPKRANEPKETKQKDGVKKPRKPREASGTKEGKEKRSCTDDGSRTKSKKASKEQGPTPMERKKKGKRKKETSMESLERDQSPPNTSLQSPEEPSEPADSQKQCSGQQVKRRKYNEDLDFKVVDDDGEVIAVLGAGRTSAISAFTLAWQAEEPPEDDANIIENILASKTVQVVNPGESPFVLELFYINSQFLLMLLLLQLLLLLSQLTVAFSFLMSSHCMNARDCSRFNLLESLLVSLSRTVIMGCICTKTGKKAAWVITEKNYTGLGNDFHNNKDLCKEIAVIPSKKPHKIAADVMHLMKPTRSLCERNQTTASVAFPLQTDGSTPLQALQSPSQLRLQRQPCFQY